MGNTVLQMLRASMFVVAVLFSTTLQPQFVDTRTDWLYRGKIGLSTHYIARKLDTLEPLAKQFQIERIASQAASAGASWFLFTIHHEPWLMMAPNAAYDRILGTTDHTSERDVPMELHKHLSSKNIRMMLYVILRMDPTSASAATEHVRSSMGGWPPNDKLINNMASVYREFSLRYGSKVSGWWVDGAGILRQSPHRERWLNQIAGALRAGNPNAIVAFNAGVRLERFGPSDFTAGEMNDLTYFPKGRWLDGAQFHAFTYLGGWWSWGGTRFPDRDLIAYSTRVVSNGGVLTFDVATLGLTGKKRGDAPTSTPYVGFIDPSQAEQVLLVVRAIKEQQQKVASTIN